MKYSYPRKTIYEERGNIAAGSLDDKIERIHKQGRVQKEEEGSKGDDDGGNDDAGEGEEREGAAYLEDDEEIYGPIAYVQGTTTNKKYDAKYDDYKEGCMVGIPQFWVCSTVHMEAVA